VVTVIIKVYVPPGPVACPDVVDVDQMRADLLAARKQRDKLTETALKRALAAFENAAAPPAQPVNMLGAERGPIEVPRLELTSEDLARIIDAELAEAEAAAQQYEAGGRADAAAQLRAENAVLERYLRK
jgi:uncharacterized protein